MDPGRKMHERHIPKNSYPTALLTLLLPVDSSSRVTMTALPVMAQERYLTVVPVGSLAILRVDK